MHSRALAAIGAAARLVGLRRYVPLLAAALLVACVSAAATAGTAPAAARPAAAGPGQARSASAGAPAGLPSKSQQIRVLTAALSNMHKHYLGWSPGPMDIFDYGIGSLWLKGIDGAGTTIAVIEGWGFGPGVSPGVKQFDSTLGLPDPQITTIYPAGPLPKECPPGMAKLGSYGSCASWARETDLDVMAAHLIAPYAKIVISATPADTQVTDDAAFQVAPPEMMKAVEFIAASHLANVISISDGNGESSYSHGAEEVTAQDPGELAAAAAGIPVLVGTGDCGVVQNLPVASSQCGTTSPEPDTGTWDDSPWVTAVGGTIDNVNASGQKVGPDPIWRQEGAGFSSIYPRPAYQNGVAHITGSPMRSVPDIAMDAIQGTSESGPLLAGVLALATQVNGDRNVGPINPVLYGALGPGGAKDGIADVISGNDSAVVNGKTVVPGFAAAKGFDVATGWGTVNGNFVPSLVAATQAYHQEAAARQQAQAQLTALETHSIRLTPPGIARNGTSYLFAPGFLPGHPVQLSIDGKPVANLTAGDLGTVAYMIDPSLLNLAPGRHVVRLDSLLLTMTATFRSS